MLQKLLDSLVAQQVDEPFELIVVDDASNDETPALLDELRAKAPFAVHLIRHDEATGPSTGRDEGWRAARGELVAFTDDDCVASPQWLEQMRAAADAMPGAIVM